LSLKGAKLRKNGAEEEESTHPSVPHTAQPNGEVAKGIADMLTCVWEWWREKLNEAVKPGAVKLRSWKAEEKADPQLDSWVLRDEFPCL
jgi:formylglycine-generating enzyme required for sulfatase activity